jgi:hypothetical protein
MYQTIPCHVCGELIAAHYQLFGHVHPPPTAPDTVDLQAERVKLMARKERIEVLQARHYGLGPIPWRSNAQPPRPLT